MGTPRHVLAWMAILTALVALGAAFAFDPLRGRFLELAPFNAAVLVLLAAGIAADFWHVARLGGAPAWIDRVRRGFSDDEAPPPLAALARVVAGRAREGFTVSALAMSALVEGVRGRMREARELPRRLLRLGLAAGFAGALWAMLDERTDAALSALFFAVAAAAVLAVFNLLARQAQRAVEVELEDFLASRTELPSTVLGGESALPAYLEELLKQSSESLQELQRLLIRGEEERRATHHAVASLTERLTELSDHLRAEHKVLVTLSRTHNQLQPAIADLAAEIAGAGAASEEARSHLRSLDVGLARLVDEVAAARSEIGVRARIPDRGQSPIPGRAQSPLIAARQ